MITKLLAVAVTAVSLLVGSTSAPAGTVSLRADIPTFTLAGVVQDKSALPIARALLETAVAGKKEAQLIIHSPGGSVTSGRVFISLMQAAKAKGLRITCYVPLLAASMAYQIFLHCDERHVLNNAFLLWHRARVNVGGGFMSPGVAITAPMARQLSEELSTVDDISFREILQAMGGEVPAAVLAKHFEAETLHLGVSVHAMAPNFVTPHTYIPGLLEHPSLKIVRPLRAMERKDNEEEPEETLHFAPGEIVYITSRIRETDKQ